MDICLLARLRVAFQKFEEIALKLPSFNRVTIILLPYHLASVDPPVNPLSLKQTFNILKLSLDSPTVKSMISQRWAINRVEQEFAKRQKQRLKAQMLAALSHRFIDYYHTLVVASLAASCVLISFNRMGGYYKRLSWAALRALDSA